MINKLIYDCIEISKDSKIPFLFLSNPGLGKTSIIKSYADANGYDIVELRGSQSSPEDILGFYVNDKTSNSLQLKLPSWFNKIISNKKPSILFLDEITTTNEYTQSALLKLVFDREIESHKLPDSCIIVSAGNYMSNLQNSFNQVIAPMINRFCVINLSLAENEVFEYVSIKPNIQKYEYNYKEIDIEKVEKLVKTFLESLFNKYSMSESPDFYINLNNKDFSSITDLNQEVYNIISPRSIHYLTKITYSLSKIKDNIDDNTIDSILLGLIGAGTLNYSNVRYMTDYQNDSVEIFKKYLALL